MTDGRRPTVGDLSPDRKIVYYPNGTAAHLVDGDCGSQHGDNEGRQTMARKMFDDVPICPTCLHTASSTDEHHSLTGGSDDD